MHAFQSPRGTCQSMYPSSPTGGLDSGGEVEVEGQGLAPARWESRRVVLVMLRWAVAE